MTMRGTKKSGLPGEASRRTPLTGSPSSELPSSSAGSSSAVAASSAVTASSSVVEASAALSVLLTMENGTPVTFRWSSARLSRCVPSGSALEGVALRHLPRKKGAAGKQ